MSLIDDSMEKCTMINRGIILDPFGTYVDGWVDGVEFDAAFSKESTLAASVAEKQGVTELYTITVEKGFPFKFHDVFRRHSDGLTYRVTTNIKDNETPKRASFSIGQVRAERWDLPDD